MTYPYGRDEWLVRAAAIATREYLFGYLSRHIPGSAIEALRRMPIQAAMVACVMDGDSVKAAMARPDDLEADLTKAYADGREDAQDEFAALLPGPYYMDPPDGGDVSVVEQVRRLAEDAARWRWFVAGLFDQGPKMIASVDAAMQHAEIAAQAADLEKKGQA